MSCTFWLANSCQICCSKICEESSIMKTVIKDVTNLHIDTKIFMKALFSLRSDCTLKMCPLNVFFPLNRSRKFSQHVSEVSNRAKTAFIRDTVSVMHFVM